MCVLRQSCLRTLPSAVYVTVSLHSGWKKHKLFPALCVLQEGFSLLLFSCIFFLSLFLSALWGSIPHICQSALRCISMGPSADLYLSLCSYLLSVVPPYYFQLSQLVNSNFFILNSMSVLCSIWIDPSCTIDWKMPQTVLRPCWHNPMPYFVSILSGITAMCFLCPISKNCSFIYFVFYDKRENSCSS